MGLRSIRRSAQGPKVEVSALVFALGPLACADYRALRGGGGGVAADGNALLREEHARPTARSAPTRRQAQ
jgi:hypothetical protein